MYDQAEISEIFLICPRQIFFFKIYFSIFKICSIQWESIWVKKQGIFLLFLSGKLRSQTINVTVWWHDKRSRFYAVILLIRFYNLRLGIRIFQPQIDRKIRIPQPGGAFKLRKESILRTEQEETKLKCQQKQPGWIFLSFPFITILSKTVKAELLRLNFASCLKLICVHEEKELHL